MDFEAKKAKIVAGEQFRVGLADASVAGSEFASLTQMFKRRHSQGSVP